MGFCAFHLATVLPDYLAPEVTLHFVSFSGTSVDKALDCRVPEAARMLSLTFVSGAVGAPPAPAPASLWGQWYFARPSFQSPWSNAVSCPATLLAQPCLLSSLFFRQWKEWVCVDPQIVHVHAHLRSDSLFVLLVPGITPKCLTVIYLA